MKISQNEIHEIIQREKKRYGSLITPLIIFPVVFLGAYLIVTSISPEDKEIAGYVLAIMGAFIMLAFFSSYSSKMKIVANFGNSLTEYYEKAAKIEFPAKTYTLNCAFSSFHQSQYVWFSAEYLSFFPWPPTMETFANYSQIDLYTLPIKNIKYYYSTGEKFHENKISGGGSTGPNIGGAIIGEQLAGIGGAIVMGQSKINPIESHLIVHDERRTVVTFRDGNGMIQELLLPIEFLVVFQEHLPGLSREIVEGNKALPTEKGKEPVKTSDSIEMKLKKLLDMKNAGLIDEKDYQEQKAKFLSQL